MSLFEDRQRPSEPERPLTVEEAGYYRRVLATHQNDVVTGVCGVCRVSRCQDWRDAYDRLATAGELMGWGQV